MASESWYSSRRCRGMKKLDRYDKQIILSLVSLVVAVMSLISAIYNYIH